MQATVTLCHLSVTDIGKTFCNVWFFFKNEACVNCGTLNTTTHRGRKGIFNCFSKFSKLIFDLSGLIDQNESKISNFIPKWLYLVVKVSKRAKNSWKKPKITLIPCFSEQNLSWQIKLISIAIIWGKKVWCYYISFEVIFSHFVKKKCHFRIY